MRTIIMSTAIMAVGVCAQNFFGMKSSIQTLASQDAKIDFDRNMSCAACIRGGNSYCNVAKN